MRIFWSLLIGAAFAFVGVLGWLALRNQDRADPVAVPELGMPADPAALRGVLDSEDGGAGISQSDFDRLVAALPDPWIVTYGDFEAASEASPGRVTALSLKRGENSQALVEIADLRLAGIDVDSLISVMSAGSTEGLADTTKVIGRIEAIDISATSLEEWYFDLFGLDEYADLAADPDLATVDWGSLKVTSGRVILEDVRLHPVVPSQKPQTELEETPATAMAEVWRQSAIDGLSASYGAFGVFETAITMTSFDAEIGTELEFSFGEILGSGLDRGDAAYSSLGDFRMKMGMRPETAEDAGLPETIVIGFSVDRFTTEDLRLSRIYEYILEGAFPSQNDVDLMSLGRWAGHNLTMTLNGAEIQSLEDISVELTQFHGLFPSRIRVESTGYRYNLDNLFGQIRASGDAEHYSEFGTVFEVIEEVGLAQLISDGTFDFSWNPDDGATNVQFLSDFREIGGLSGLIDITLTDYQTAYPVLVEELQTEWNIEGPSKPDIGRVWGSDFAINRGEFVLTDSGGVEKGFAIAVALADRLPEGELTGPLISIRGADPQELRMTTATLMRISGLTAGSALSNAKPFVNAAADFVAKGGRLVLKIEPDQPITEDRAAEIERLATEQGPDAVIDALGVSVKQAGRTR